MNAERIQEIHDDATQDFENLSSLLIVAKSLYDEQPEIWQGLDEKIYSATYDIGNLLRKRNLVRESYLNIYYIILIISIHDLFGFIDGCSCCGKRDDELDIAKNQAKYFGSLYAFNAKHSDEYFSVFLPLLEKFMDENSDLFA